MFGFLLSSSWCCPNECSCKWKSGKITVECSDRGLISIPSGIDQETQVLDISGNDLQMLQQNTFQKSGLINLQKMHMRSCRLGEIDKNAFRGLSNLLEIDLSDNLLTHVPSQAFEDIPYLRNISLARNPIKRIEAFAFRLVPHLTKLDLSRCKIQTVKPQAFSGLDVLDHLKLNDNELQELPVETVRGLTKLRTIELHGNNWKCDCRLRGIKIWLSEYNLHVPQPMFCTSGPERLKDKQVSELDADDFACKPIIKMDTRQLEAAVNSNISIECRVESDPVATVSWYFSNGQLLSNNSIYDSGQRLYIIENDDNVYDKRSRLVLRRVEESDTGDYHCVAENRAGNDEANFTLHIVPGTSSIVALSSTNINVITIGLGILIVFMLAVIIILVKKIKHTSYPDTDAKHIKHPLEKNSVDTSSQKSHDSEIKSDSGKAFTVTSDLSYSRSLSDIGNPTFSNPDLISGTNIRDSTCITPLPITRPISDYCQNWQKSYAMPRAASTSGFNYDIHDRMPMVVDTVSAGSGSDEVFSHSRMSNDYPPDYGLPILPENSAGQPCAKTLKVWQRGVPVLPPMCSGPPPSAFQTLPPHIRNSPADRRYQRCGTDV